MGSHAPLPAHAGNRWFVNLNPRRLERGIRSEIDFTCLQLQFNAKRSQTADLVYLYRLCTTCAVNGRAYCFQTSIFPRAFSSSHSIHSNADRCHFLAPPAPFWYLDVRDIRTTPYAIRSGCKENDHVGSSLAVCL
jgi:hypothetical protein